MSDAALINSAIVDLSLRCPVFSRLYSCVGVLEFETREMGFNCFLRTVVNQQLSSKAAETILNRIFVLGGGDISSLTFSQLQDDSLRKCGLSRAKIGYLKNIAQLINEGKLCFKQLNKLTDEELRRELVSIKGIGRWSAEIIMLFYFQRLAVFPLGDVSLEKAFEELLEQPKSQIENYLLEWSPYSGLVALYFWHYVDNPVLYKEF